MNRADLDRCIGELYPLLSASVQQVHPAGIPWVRTIANNDRFRVIATVNDATLDDIVFPISEGLARRFQRIALPGASEDDVVSYIGLGGAKGEKVVAAVDAVKAFFGAAQGSKLLKTVSDVDRLRFGAGYFGLLRMWCVGALELPGDLIEGELPAQALEMVRASLSTLAKVGEVDEIIDQLVGGE